jgi:hypothetical protein
MMRSFEITMPDDTKAHNLFSLLVGTSVYGAAQGGTNETGITGAIPTDGILPDRVNFLRITGDSGNGDNLIAIQDRNSANNAKGDQLGASVTLNYGPFNRNSLCLKDYILTQSESGEVQIVEVLIESF